MNGTVGVEERSTYPFGQADGCVSPALRSYAPCQPLLSSSVSLEKESRRMSAPVKTEKFAAFTGIQVGDEPLDFGDGLFLQKAHLKFEMPFSLIKPKLKSTDRREVWLLPGQDFDSIESELHFMENSKYLNDFDKTLRAFVFMLRIFVNPEVLNPIISNTTFSTIIDVALAGANLLPRETQTRHIIFKLANESADSRSMADAKQAWPSIYQLYTESSEFRLAADAFDSVHFVINPGLALVSIWGAIESIFSPSTSELKFRVSSLVSSYLFRHDRHENQKNIAKMYDKRSSAAHGRTDIASKDLTASVNLLRLILIKIIQDGRVPSKDELEQNLFR
ncbi:MAG: hypothetical protein ABI444_13225 [Candidatus Kapaibacterium sp.]